MRSNHSRWRIALTAGAASAGLLVAAPVAAQTAHTSAAAKAHPRGFFVTGAGRVTSGPNHSAFVRDSNGGLHVVTTVQSASASGDRGRIVYSTKKPGAKHWVTHAVPGLRPLAGGVQVEAHLNWSDNKVFAVFYECDGVFVAQATFGATRLPQPSLVQAADTCATTSAKVKAGSPAIAKAVALPYGDAPIGILLPDPSNANVPTLFIGAAGKPFTAWYPLQTTSSFSALTISVDTDSYYLTAVGTGVGTGKDAGVLGIYSTSAYIYGGGWSTPTLIATLNSKTRDFTVESVATVGTSAWVGLLKPPSPSGPIAHTLYLDHGTDLIDAPQWTGAFVLPHSTSRDTGLILGINAATGHPHAVFTRVDTASKTKRSGIMVEDLLSGSRGWSKPKFLTHWYRDHADQMAITPTGKTIIGYDQR